MAFGTGGTLSAIVLMMVLGATGLAAHASVTMHPPFPGGVSPTNSANVFGCGKISLDKQWIFKLGTGIGGSSSAGSANACKHQIYGIGGYSSASVNGGVEVVIPVKTPVGASSVTVNSAISYTVALKAADGSLTGRCTAGLSVYHDHYEDWEWGYNGLYFTNYAYNDSYEYGGIWYNYSYNLGSVPSPFNFNNSSYFYNSTSYGASGGCQANAFALVDGNMWMVDETTGTYISANNTSLPGGCNYCGGSFEPLYVQLTVTNYTDWYCSAFYYWDGPYNTSYGSNTTTCYSYNQTLTSEIFQYIPGSSSTSCYGFAYPYLCTFYNGTGTISWTNSTAATGQTWFNQSFVHGDHYALFIEVFTDASAYQSWAHGSASWNLNMLTLGHGFRVSSITIT